MSRHNRDVLRVAAKACDECLFGPHKIVDDARKAGVLADCLRRARHFECHKGTLRGDPVMCAGYRAHAERGHDPKTALLLRLGRGLGVVQVVDPATGERVDEGSE